MNKPKRRPPVLSLTAGQASSFCRAHQVMMDLCPDDCLIAAAYLHKHAAELAAYHIDVSTWYLDRADYYRALLTAAESEATQ